MELRGQDTILIFFFYPTLLKYITVTNNKILIYVLLSFEENLLSLRQKVSKEFLLVVNFLIAIL